MADHATGNSGDAWWYRYDDPRYMIGASMCYWRSAWEARPFDDAPAEDYRWWSGNTANCAGRSAMLDEPRMVCGIHGGNTAPYELRECDSWRRVPEYDEWCERTMGL